jgi:hypothetical protein
MASCHATLAAYECELMGLVQVVRHWRPYLQGHSFIVHIDLVILKFLLDQRLSMIPQHQWVRKLLGFDFRVEYRSGASNTVTDALSRCDTEEAATVHVLSAPSFQLLDGLCAEVEADPALVAL